MRQRLKAVPAPTMHLWLMLVLTFTTGINDAVGYLGLDKVFTGNMTGNVVILGMALVGGEDLPVAGPALALVGFMLGAALAGRVLRHSPAGWTSHATLLFGSVAALMAGLAATLLATEGEPAFALQVSVTTFAAAAMGLQAATARHIGVKDVTTVVVTSTITGLAADSRLGRRQGAVAGRRLAAVSLMMLGAAVGGVLVVAHLALALLLAGILIALVASLGAWHAHGSTGG